MKKKRKQIEKIGKNEIKENELNNQKISLKNETRKEEN